MFNSNSDKRSSKVLYSAPQDVPDTTTVPSQLTTTLRQNASKDGNRSGGPVKSLFNKIGAKVPARLVLYFLSWSGFLVSFMMRNDINFALNAMTRPVEMSPDEFNTTAVPEFENSSLVLLSGKIVNHKDEDFYPWSSTIKSVIISSFYWCYVLSQVVGGIATQYFGTKQVFGWSQFVTAACSLCIPASADLHYAALIALRSIQGFASGLTWPAMYAIVSFWIPLSERSRFMSSFQGFSIGIGLTYPLCGFIIDNMGWRYVFYCTGSLGMLWCILWYFFAFNTPQEHPRITTEELNYIEMNVSDVTESLGMKVPWCKIFTSVPAWAIGITTFGRIWIHYIFIVGGPNFMKNMLKFNYQKNGFLSGMPFICSYISSVIFCYAADKIMVHRWMSLTNVRKVFTALSQVVPGLLIYWIGYIENDIVLLLVIWFVAVTFITASYAGAMANIVDIAPNLAGPVLAFCQTIHMSASFLSPLVLGIIVTNENAIDQWRTVFATSSAVTILTYIFYLIYATAEVQKWNYPQQRSYADGSSEESQILKRQTEEPIPKND